MKEELYIKTPSGKWGKADLSEKSNIILAYKNNLLGTIGTIKSSYSYTVSLPKTAKNMQIFQLCNLPSVRVINGTKIIGEPFQVRYRKEGIDILGDAVGFLDGVTKEAFEISLSFGFLGTFSDWIENENKLNDLGDYNTFVRYDNNLTDYPSSGNIDDLPAIFKPYYDIGFKPTVSGFAPLPFVKISYLNKLIEDSLNCKFSFPENISEKLKTLAVALTNKAITSKIAGKSMYIGSGSPIIEGSIDPLYKGFRISPIMCDNFVLGNTIEDVLSAENVFIESIREGEKEYKNLNISATGITSNVDQRLMISFSATFTRTTNNDATFYGSGNLWFLEIDEKGIGIVKKTVVMTYQVGKEVSISATMDQFEIETKDGYKYAFVLICETPYSEDIFANSIDNTHGSFRVSSMDYDGLCSIDCNLAEAQSVGIIPFIPLKGNLPDISQVDFIQSLCDMFGVFPVINPVPKKDDNTGKRIIEFVSIDTLFKNKVSRYVYGKKFNDWTDRLITDPNDIEISFSKDGYYQRNYLRYAKDDTVTGDHDGYFDIPDKSLDKEGELVEMPFSASDGNKIIILQENKDTDGNIKYTFESFEPRIMSIIKRDDGKCGLTFDGLDFKTLLSKYYSRYIELVQDMYLITVTVELNALDLKNIDYTYPVYFKQFRRYFGIVDIQTSSNDDNCEVTLLRLSAG